VERKWLRILYDVRWKKSGSGPFPIFVGRKWLRIFSDISWKESGSGHFPILVGRKVAQGSSDE